jgi:hypothetical protein
MNNIYHYCTLLSLNFVRAFTGRPLLDDVHTTPEDMAGLKIVSAYCFDGGHHMSFQYKGKLYTMDVKVIDHEFIKVDKPLTVDDVISKGGLYA